MSKSVAAFLSRFVCSATAWMNPYRAATTRALVAEQLMPRMSSETKGGPIFFEAPSARAIHDAWDVYKGEPETIRWLDQLPEGGVLWDIGANVGVYTLYAARARKMNVLAFEPSAASYAALVRNIEINRMTPQPEAYNLAFDETTHLDALYMAETSAGHSMHAFGQTESVEGPIAVQFKQPVVGFSVDDFCRLFHPALPEHIKLDVDSIEFKILKGAEETLGKSVKTLMVEIDERRTKQTGIEIRAFLTNLGFKEDEAFMAAGAARNVLFRRG